METDLPARIQLLGINTNDNSDIKPSGYHLRWFVPKKYGYPAGKFEIFYLESSEFNNFERTSIDFKDLRLVSDSVWSKRNRIINLGIDRPALILDKKETYQTNNSGFKTRQTGDKDHILIKFPNPVLEVSLEFLNIENPIQKKIKVFYGNAKIGEYPFMNQILIRQPNITTLLIPINSYYLSKLIYLPEEIIISSFKNNNTKIQDIRIPSDFNNAYRLVNNVGQLPISNYFLKDCENIDNFRNKYKRSEVETLIDKQNQVLNNTDSDVNFPNSYGLNRDKRVSVFQFLQFASLDPNIARLMGLYWVHRNVRSSDNEGLEGLFIITGDYSKNNIYSKQKLNKIFGFHFFNRFIIEPEINGDIKLKQLPGITYDARQPLGRIGLKCPKSETIFFDPKLPVFLDIKSKLYKQDKSITKAVNSKSDYCHTEDNIPIDKKVIRYNIAPIDIFGQYGKYIKSNEITLVDLEHPAPPKNIKASIKQTGFPWHNPYLFTEKEIKKGSIDLSFEYGDTQHKMSPDAKEVKLLWAVGEKNPESNTTPPTLEYDEINNGYNNKWKELNGMIDLTNHITKGVTDISRLNIISFNINGIIIRNIDELKENNNLPNDSSIDTTIQDDESFKYQIEFLLDRSISEPHIFDGYILNYNDLQFTIYESSAGLGYDDDETENKDLTARLYIHLTEDQFDNSGFNSESNTNNITISHPKNLDPDNLDNIFIDTLISNHGYDNDNKHFLESDQDEIPSNKFSAERYTPLLNVFLFLDKDDGPANTSFNFGELAIDFSYLIDENEEIVAVDYNEPLASRRTETIITRLVAIPKTSVDNIIQYLVRVKPMDYLKLIRLVTQGPDERKFECFFYEPLTKEDIKLGLNGEDGVIKIELDSEPIKKIWFTGYTIDDGGKKSLELASPFESRILNPPVLSKPNIPYPCDTGKDAEKGFVSIPKNDGFSKVCLAWEEESHKYEVARTSASSIITVDKKNWLLGEDTDHLNFDNITLTNKQINNEGNIEFEFNNNEIEDYRGDNSLIDGVVTQNNNPLQIIENNNVGNGKVKLILKGQDGVEIDNETAKLFQIPIISSEHVLGELKDYVIDNANGTLTFEVLNPTDDLFQVLKKCTQGSLRFTYENDDKHYFQLLNVNKEDDNGTLVIKLTCRPFKKIEDLLIKQISEGTDFIAESPPDYSMVLKSDFALRRLADVKNNNGIPKNIDAFGIVTNMPIRGTSFIDSSVIGTGTSRYFYKVREISPGNSVSQWSDCSVGFYQLDLSKPQTPENLISRQNGNSIELIWDAVKEPDFHKIEVYRFEDEQEDINIGTLSPIETIDLNNLEYLPLRANNGTLVLPEKILLNSSEEEEEMLIQMSLKTANSDVDLIVRETSALEGGIIKKLNPLVPDNTSVTIMVQNENEQNAKPIKYIPGSNKEPLRVINSEIDLNFYYPDFVSIEGVYHSIFVPEGADLNNITGENLLEDPENTPEVNLNDLNISNFSEALNNASVVVIIKKGNGDLRDIRYEPGTGKPLKIINAEINLVLSLTLEQIKTGLIPHNTYINNNWNIVSILLKNKSNLKIDDHNQIHAICEINPLISNSIDLKYNNNSKTYEKDTQYFHWINESTTENELHNNIQYNFFLKNIKETIVSDNKSVILSSSASNIDSTTFTDKRIPGTPEISEVAKIRIKEEDLELKVKLITDDIANYVSFEYRYVDEIVWKKIELTNNTFWHNIEPEIIITIPYKNKILLLKAISQNESYFMSEFSSIFSFENIENQ